MTEPHPFDLGAQEARSYLQKAYADHTAHADVDAEKEREWLLQRLSGPRLQAGLASPNEKVRAQAEKMAALIRELLECIAFDKGKP